MKTYGFTVLSLLTAVLLLSWGETGHRTIGQMAQNHLQPKAQAAVKELLGTESMADVATWADEVRNEAAYKETGSWHFLNVPLGLSYTAFETTVKNMGPDNVYGALQKCERILNDPKSTKLQKSEALKFIIHFVGDLHQPMHISRAEDKGGNTIQLNYEGKGTNLHSLWDTKLIEHTGLSYQALAQKYDHLSASQIKAWQSDPLIRWMWESYEVSSTLYAEVDAMKGRSIDQQYYDAHIGIIQDRVAKAGIRLAGLLNELFKNGLTQSSENNVGFTPPAATNNNTTFCDKVYSSKVMDGSGMTLINLGGSYPNQKMTIMIKGKDRSKFSISPATAFQNKQICVTGTVIDYKGKAEIIVSEPSQIQVR